MSGFDPLYKLVRDDAAKPRNREGLGWEKVERPRLIEFFRKVWLDHSFDRAIAMHPFYYGPPVQFVGAELGKPVSVMFHGFELRSQLIRSERLRAIKCWFSGNGPTLRQVTLDLARNADQIIANSSFTKREVKRTLTRAPVHVSGCGIDANQAELQIGLPSAEAKRIRDNTRADLGVGKDEFLVGSLCRLVPHKNVEVMIKAIELIDDAKGLIIGDGPERETLKRVVIEKGLADRIIFRHKESEQSKWRLLRAMDAFTLLTGEGPQGQVEGFGIVILEASAAGVPVVASNSGGIRDVVTNQVTGLTTQVGCPKSVADALFELKKDSRLGHRLVSNAQAKIQTNFNWSTIAEKLHSSW